MSSFDDKKTADHRELLSRKKVNNQQSPQIRQHSLQRTQVTLRQLTKTFLFISVTSFGGGITAYIRRIIVDKKGWLTNDEFFPGLAFCQLLPGANVVGISLYIGHHLCGLPGALVAGLCIVLPPAVLFFGLGYLYFSIGTFPSVEAMLKGTGAVACGLMASMLVESAKESLNNVMDCFLFVVTFLLIHLGHFHVPYVILMMAPLAIWWYRPRPAKKIAKTITTVAKHVEQDHE